MVWYLTSKDALSEAAEKPEGLLILGEKWEYTGWLIEFLHACMNGCMYKYRWMHNACIMYRYMDVCTIKNANTKIKILSKFRSNFIRKKTDSLISDIRGRNIWNTCSHGSQDSAAFGCPWRIESPFYDPTSQAACQIHCSCA